MKRNLKFAVLCSILVAACTALKNDKTLADSSPENDTTISSKLKQISNRKRIIDSVNTSLEWQKTSFDLWKSQHGDLAIKTSESNEEGIFIDRYISSLCCGLGDIKDVIDTSTFKHIGNAFYKDKNNVYLHYVMADGGNFQFIETADVQTFEILGSCYAKDKNHIFDAKARQLLNIDYQTFTTCATCGCFAKDKFGYYFWDIKIDSTELNDMINGNDEAKNIIEKLRKL